jgi:hypothetical protein
MIDEDDCGAIGGMKIGRGNRSTRRKPAPAPLCPPQIPHDKHGDRFTFYSWLTKCVLNTEHQRRSFIIIIIIIIIKLS